MDNEKMSTDISTEELSKRVEALEQKINDGDDSGPISMIKLWSLISLILLLVFLFWGTPDVWDQLHQKIMKILN